MNFSLAFFMTYHLLAPITAGKQTGAAVAQTHTQNTATAVTPYSPESAHRHAA